MSAPVSLFDSNGIEVFRGTQSPGGGSSVQVVSVPIAFNTPNLAVTGIVAYTPAAGQLLACDISALVILTGWNGTGAPTLNLVSDGTTGPLGNVGIGSPSAPIDSGNHVLNTTGFFNQPVAYFADANPLRLYVDDGNGGDPGSTAGAGVLVLYVIA